MAVGNDPTAFDDEQVAPQPQTTVTEDYSARDEEDISPIMIGSDGFGSLLEKKKQKRNCIDSFILNVCRMGPLIFFEVVIGVLLIVVAIAMTVPMLRQGQQQRPEQPQSLEAAQVNRTDNRCVNEVTGGISWQSYMEMWRQLNGTDRCSNGRSHCSCGDYSIPAFPAEDSRKHNVWLNTFAENLARIQDYIDSGTPHLDVVMLGDSITAHWLGGSLNGPDPSYQDIIPVYEHLFRPENGSDIAGLALGIGGDQCPNLLYRIENGEMNDALQPAVWWILIGTNDVGGGFCKDEIVISGIILIAQTIHKWRPNATVVINSILPRGSEKKLAAPDQLSKINHAVACYAEGHDRIEFFNASSLFLQSDGMALNTALYQDSVHPNAEGAAIWGEAIVKKVKEIIQANQ